MVKKMYKPRLTIE